MIRLAEFPHRRRATPQHRDPLRLEEIVRRRLRESSYVQLRSIACQCSAGTVLLTGRVSSFYLKQVAQSVVGYVDGVEQVDNRLEVLERPGRDSESRFVFHQGG